MPDKIRATILERVRYQHLPRIRQREVGLDEHQLSQMDLLPSLLSLDGAWKVRPPTGLDFIPSMAVHGEYEVYYEDSRSPADLPLISQDELANLGFMAGSGDQLSTLLDLHDPSRVFLGLVLESPIKVEGATALERVVSWRSQAQYPVSVRVVDAFLSSSLGIWLMQRPTW